MPPPAPWAEQVAARGVLARYKGNPSYGNSIVKPLVNCYEANLANDKELIKLIDIIEQSDHPAPGYPSLPIPHTWYQVSQFFFEIRANPVANRHPIFASLVQALEESVRAELEARREYQTTQQSLETILSRQGQFLKTLRKDIAELQAYARAHDACMKAKAMAPKYPRNEADDPRVMTDPAKEDKSKWKSRTAFVTTGATASFRALLEEVITPEFLMMLQALGYTDLVVQCGGDRDYFVDLVKKLGYATYGIKIRSFGFTSDIKTYMRQAARGDSDARGMRGMGVIITHAGGSIPGRAGSIMDALHFDTKVIAVANPTLMDNHQEEIAEEMQRKGYCIHARLGCVATALKYVDGHSPKNWPPQPPADSAYQDGLWGAISDNMPQGGQAQQPGPRQGLQQMPEEREEDDESMQKKNPELSGLHAE
ncbi:Uu.00g101020.m01.CDS01 [Anthostomella pinea]|uniref:UDP-N-acetylglucosamine transferase subunit ALG13 n=1 Tax=Anthostomella pinea TaxID=933095 RepID=A0AAI8VDS2_9PEZI|nr:Uu.00g101020.m01.CDS01 [Anthostomella pinea]